MTFVIMTGGIDLSVGAVVALSAVAAARLSGDGLWVARRSVRLASACWSVSSTAAHRASSIAALHRHPGPAAGRPGSGPESLGQRAVCRSISPAISATLEHRVGPVPIIGGSATGVDHGVALHSRLDHAQFHPVRAPHAGDRRQRRGGPPGRAAESAAHCSPSTPISGALAGLAGAFLAAQGYTGSPIAGIGWELTAIAAVVVGGTLLTGGRGSVGTTLVGVLLLGLIFNELNFERGKGIFDLTHTGKKSSAGSSCSSS